MSVQNHIRVIGRNREKSEIGSAENMVVFDLSAVPDQEWTTIFTNGFEERLEFLPLEFYNVQPRFKGKTLSVIVPAKADLRSLEQGLRAVAEIANTDHCPDDHSPDQS